MSASHLHGDGGDDGPPERSEDRLGGSDAPSPGERLLYALGQLYRRWRRGMETQAPGDIDVWEVAGFIGVRPDIEFISEDFAGMHVHFADEVLCVSRLAEFPWQLKSVWEWAFDRELADVWLEGGFD